MQHRTIGRFVFATLLVALGKTPPAAAIDLDGDYVSFGDAFTVTAVQTGTTLQMMGDLVSDSTTYPLSATGIVDPATGEFSVAGEITGLCPDFVYSGTGDGEEITGTLTSRTCPGYEKVSFTLVLSKCGSGVIDPPEDCEFGNVGGDCCSGRCRLRPAGTACTNDGNDCTDDVCDATGTCTHGRTVALTDLGPFDAAGHEAPQILSSRPAIRHTMLAHAPLGAGHLLRKLPQQPNHPLPRRLCGRLSSQDGLQEPRREGAPVHRAARWWARRLAVRGHRREPARLACPLSRPASCEWRQRGRVVPARRQEARAAHQVRPLRTDQIGAFIARGRVLFGASANFGENPHQICQLFSIGTLSTGLRQLTHLPWDGRRSATSRRRSVAG